VAVVDPGVGSARRGVAIASGAKYYVGPDNGLFTAVLRDSHGWHAVELTEPRYARPDVSKTFEGRDRFAPAAAWLARGSYFDSFGPLVTDLVTIDIPQPSHDPFGVLHGVVLRVDRFGNLVTNLRRGDISGVSKDVVVRIAGVEILGVVATYAQAAPGALCALVGSSDHLEIAANGGSAASVLGVDRGAAVQVHGRSGA
jgi:S-adenosylmethionine hydrolase